MKMVGIIVNILFAILAVIVICNGISLNFHEDGISWELHDKINIVIALLLMIVSMLFTQVYCNGSKK